MLDPEILQGLTNTLVEQNQRLNQLRQKYALPSARQSPQFADEHIAFNREAIAATISVLLELIEQLGKGEVTEL